jgi:hypothetical protein
METSMNDIVPFPLLPKPMKVKVVVMGIVYAVLASGAVATMMQLLTH